MYLSQRTPDKPSPSPSPALASLRLLLVDTQFSSGVQKHYYAAPITVMVPGANIIQGGPPLHRGFLCAHAVYPWCLVRAEPLWGTPFSGGLWPLCSMRAPILVNPAETLYHSEF